MVYLQLSPRTKPGQEKVFYHLKKNIYISLNFMRKVYIIEGVHRNVHREGGEQ